MYFGLCFSLYISVAGLVAFSFTMGRLYTKIMATVLDVENFLIQLDVQFKYCTRTIILDMALRAATIFATSIANYNQYSDDALQLYLRAVGFYLTHWCVNCVEMQIVAMCSYLSCLIKYTTSSLPSPDFEGFLEASTSFVEISEMIHELFSKPSFVIFGNIFICTTLDLYFLIVVLPEMESMSIKWFSLGRCFARCYQLWRFVSAVNSMSDEVIIDFYNY
ncbi:unnamed protein product [Nezara viridula]|uniref:Uncharacterized protein n=1 Tax=Nezara viridula TaxID=85310 RepID=A0A9P0MNG5_NEZVI|nr:unnamed protein product [Nezara viridula]